MMKELALIMSYPLKPELAAGNRMRSFLKVAQSKGLKVTIYSLQNHSTEQIFDENYRSIPPVRQLFPGFIGRAIQEVIFTRRLYKELEEKKYDKILVSIPSMFLFFCAPFWFSRRSHLDIRDLTWEYLSETSALQKIAKIIFRFLAKKRASSFASVTVTNPSEFSYACNQLGYKESEVTLLPNGISREQFNSLSGMISKPRKTKDSVIVSYVGNIGIPQNLSVLVDAAKSLPQVTFQVIGEGQNLEELTRYKEKRRVSNFNLIGSLSWDKLIHVYQESDILYAQLNQSFSGAVPSKLYEYLSTGKFIIYGGEGEALRLLADFENKITISPDDPDALVEAIKVTIKDKMFEENSAKNKDKIKKRFIREDHIENWFEKIS